MHSHVTNVTNSPKIAEGKEKKHFSSDTSEQGQDQISYKELCQQLDESVEAFVTGYYMAYLTVVLLTPLIHKLFFFFKLMWETLLIACFMEKA